MVTYEVWRIYDLYDLNVKELKYKRIAYGLPSYSHAVHVAKNYIQDLLAEEHWSTFSNYVDRIYIITNTLNIHLAYDDEIYIYRDIRNLYWNQLSYYKKCCKCIWKIWTYCCRKKRAYHNDEEILLSKL